MKPDIGLMRLAAHRLSTSQSSTPAEAVRHMLAMQAQDYAGSLWAIGLRTDGSTQQAVEQAIASRQIVRSWPMRGTLHFMHADDIHWLLQLLAPRATAGARNRRINMLGLTDEIVNEAESVLRDFLKGGKSIVRNQVVKLLQANVKGISIDNQHTQHLMRNFGERGVICFGPNEGKQPTFVLLNEWVPKSAEQSRGQALIELARRYFISHGPATLKDFSGWAMLTITDAKHGLEGALTDLAVLELNGLTYYHAPGLQPVNQPHVLLLPGFDEYLLGYKDRGAVLATEHANKIVPGGNGMFLSSVIDKGQVVGLWKRTITKRAVNFSYENFYKTANTVTCEKQYTNFIHNLVP